MSQLSNLAYTIWVDYVDKAEDTNPAYIASWLISNLGRLNVLLNKNYSVINNDFSPKMNNEEFAIFSYFYLVNYYDKMVRKALRGILLFSNSSY